MSNSETRNPARENEPRIVAFFCNWCTYTASDLAGTSRLSYPANIRIVRVMCSGRIEPQMVIDALAKGADGVLIGGCHPGDCHYQSGNQKCAKRFQALRAFLGQLGVEPERVRLEWIAASEGDKLQRVAREMTDDLRRLGGLTRRVAQLEAAPGAAPVVASPPGAPA